MFTVQKRRVQQSKLIGQRREIIRKNQANKPINRETDADGKGDTQKNGGRDGRGYKPLDNKYEQDDD